MKLTKAFLAEIRELVASARNSVARGVDLVQVCTNFEIGQKYKNQRQTNKSGNSPSTDWGI